MRWNHPEASRPHGRDGTLARVIEAVDRNAPETKADLADQLGLSQHYLSELLQELKADGVVRKAYVVDEEAVYAAAESISEVHAAADSSDRSELLALLRRLDETTVEQYRAARAAVEGEEPDPSADELEPLANERCLTAIDELKSLTLTTGWPENRVAADLATIAMAMEIVGDRACFVADAVRSTSGDPVGIVHERVVDVFDGGETIHGLLGRILFEGEVDRLDDLYAEEGRIHRTLDELFELVTAYDPESYGRLVVVTRALERSIYYWVNAAEIATRLHTHIDPDHLSV